MDSYPSRLLVGVIFILVIALLRTAQVVVDNASEARISKMTDSSKTQKILKILDKSSRIYNGIRFLIIVLELMIAADVTLILKDWILDNNLDKHIIWIIPVTLIAVSFIIQLIGICIPKKIAAKNPEKALFTMSWLINFTHIITIPIERLLSLISSLVLLPFGVTHTDEDEDEVTEEEIRFMVDVGSESGAIDPDEKEMIHNIFELDDTPVRDVMTHRTDVVFLWNDENIDTWEETITTTNHTIYPVCGETVDDILGFIKATDFYKYLRNPVGDISDIIRNPYLVPESVKADDLFRQMQKTKNHFAIVLDEYGGLAGITTMSDLLEEIVGDLDNDSEAPEDEEITQIDSNTWKILGSTDIDTVSKILDVELPIEEYNTFAGMILGELGAIPDDGTTAEIEAYGLQIKITKVFEHRIDEALVCKIEQSTED
ncbi:MAG: HlyC/CorC family transporter [Clostridia bacterium]|nr:HlyC/CorC family transporter [Clostridia bacterium]